MKLKNRHYLRSSEIKQLKNEVSSTFGSNNLDKLFPKNIKIEIAEIEGYFPVYIFNKEFLLFRLNNKLIPSLKCILKNILDLPKIVVDSGALKFILNGADIMRPGIIHIDNYIKKDQFIKIVEETYNRPIAIGLSLYDSTSMKNMSKGKVIKNIHYLNDKLWTLFEKSS
ncbi:MAG: DUF1947 domain-containing protein [Candidatus Helarchaeota archaeon]